jgi:NADPH:quinone reductase-like Zn-dependent oxidoreductase
VEGSSPNQAFRRERGGGLVKAIVHERYGLEGVEVRDLAKPLAAPHQVLVRVHASSVNPLDWYTGYGPPSFRAVSRQLRRPKDCSLGADLAGSSRRSARA